MKVPRGEVVGVKLIAGRCEYNEDRRKEKRQYDKLARSNHLGTERLSWEAVY